MSIAIARSVLLWCTVINYAVLMTWFLLLVLPHGWLYRLCSRWFRLTAEQFDALNLGGLMVYKLGIALFNLVPLIALYIVK
jgi:hypothetical protein